MRGTVSAQHQTAEIQISVIQGSCCLNCCWYDQPDTATGCLWCNPAALQPERHPATKRCVWWASCRRGLHFPAGISHVCRRNLSILSLNWPSGGVCSYVLTSVDGATCILTEQLPSGATAGCPGPGCRAPPNQQNSSVWDEWEQGTEFFWCWLQASGDDLEALWCLSQRSLGCSFCIHSVCLMSAVSLLNVLLVSFPLIHVFLFSFWCFCEVNWSLAWSGACFAWHHADVMGF